MQEYTLHGYDEDEAKQPAGAGCHPTTCSGSSFEWITPDDPRWEQWNHLDWKILVMTSEGPSVVRVSEDGPPAYYCFDDVGLADPDEWTAWSRIPRLPNA